MRASARILGAAAGATLGALAMSAPAFADTIDSDGVNLADDNNISILPVQACGNDIAAVIGVVIPILSPESVKCSDNAPIVDDIGIDYNTDDEKKHGEEPTEEAPEHHDHAGKGAPHAGR